MERECLWKAMQDTCLYNRENLAAGRRGAITWYPI
jgi:hypothetical protein